MTHAVLAPTPGTQPGEPPDVASPVLLFCEAISHGHVVRCLGLAEALCAAGVGLVVAVPARLQHHFRAIGIAVADLQVVDTALLFARLCALEPTYTTAEIDGYYLQDKELLDRWRPRLVLSDHRVTAIQLAHRLGIPTVSLAEATVLPGFDPGSCSLPDGLARPRWCPMPVLDAFARTSCWRRLAGRIARRLAEPWRVASRRHGAAELDTYLDYVSAGDLVLAADHPGLWPQVRLRPQDRYIGPCAARDHRPLPTELLDRIAGRVPLVYVSLGTQPALDPQLLLGELRGLLDAGYALVVSRGGRPVELPLTHERLLVLDFINDDLFLQHCDALVYGGGSCTTWKALAAGVPLVCLPAHPNQHFYADALGKAGVARLLRPNRLRRGQLVAAVRNALAAPMDAHHEWRRLLLGSSGAQDAVRLLLHAFPQLAGSRRSARIHP